MKTGWCGHSALTGGLPGAELRVRVGGRPLVWMRPAEGRMCTAVWAGSEREGGSQVGCWGRKKRLVWG